MTTWPVKRRDYFGSASVEQERLGRFLEYGLPLLPQPPGQITDWTVTAALLDGRVVFGINDLPEPGDLAHYGDARGAIIGIAWSAGAFSGEFPATIGTDAIVDLPEAAWGDVLAFTVSAIGSAGTGPASAPITITVPFTPPDVFAGFPYTLPFNLG